MNARIERAVDLATQIRQEVQGRYDENYIRENRENVERHIERAVQIYCAFAAAEIAEASRRQWS